MEFLTTFASLFSNFGNLTWQMVVMWAVGGLLIYLAIAKQMEPSLLLPMGFGAILVNLPLSGAITQGETVGPITELFRVGMSNELFPLLLFIGIGAMIDFGPLLEKPWLMFFGAAAQFGIFFTLFAAGFFFELNDAASIAVIGAADGPTAIFVANVLGSKYLGAIMVAAYSYMALVPIVQPPVIRLVTTRKERLIRMPYEKGHVSRLTRILFPIVVTVIAGLVAPASVALVGFLMFGNLLRECGVLNALSETAQNVLTKLITIVLGLTVAGQMTADQFVRLDTLLILALGLVAFVFDTIGGVLFAKLINLFLPEGKKLNPMIGAAGISAFPMSGRVVNKMGLEEDNQNFLLMYSLPSLQAGCCSPCWAREQRRKKHAAFTFVGDHAAHPAHRDAGHLPGHRRHCAGGDPAGKVYKVKIKEAVAPFCNSLFCFVNQVSGAAFTAFKKSRIFSTWI